MAENKGQFKKGHDSRRHELTHEERQRGGVNGFKAAWESLERRFPGCDPHFLLCAILKSKPYTHFLPLREEGTGED